MLAYNNQQMPNPMNGGGGQYQQPNMMPPNASPQPQQQPNSNFINNYASDYLKTVKENRSEYGNHIDNSLAYDPAKEHKSVYNVVYETDAYNPWGKPGGGAPRLNNSGQLNNKIEGRLWWNLNGETEEDRLKRLGNSKNMRNTLLYKKDPSSTNLSPRGNQATTYNYNYRDPQQLPNSSMGFTNNSNPNFGNNSSQAFDFNSNSTASFRNGTMGQQSTVPQMPPINGQYNPQSMETHLEREAQLRQLQRANSLPKGQSELNRVSNKLYNDNQPTPDYPNHSYWFGRAGAAPKILNGPPPSKTIYYGDARRKNLLDALENRSPRVNMQMNPNNTANYTFVNSPESNHRNNYENQLKMQM